MTTAQQEPQVQQEAAWESAPYVQFGIPGVPYSAIRVPLMSSPVEAAAWADRAIKMAVYLAKKYAEAFPDAKPEPQEPRPRPQQRGSTRPQGRSPQGSRRGGGGRGQSRADRFELFPGETCDACGGPVGVYPQTGNMSSDKLVCLGTCKDDGGYVHTVRWLDDDSDQPY